MILTKVVIYQRSFVKHPLTKIRQNLRRLSYTRTDGHPENNMRACAAFIAKGPKV